MGVKSSTMRPSTRAQLSPTSSLLMAAAVKCNLPGGGYGGGVTADIKRGHRSFNAANAAHADMLERASMDVSDTRYDATILSTNTPR